MAIPDSCSRVEGYRLARAGGIQQESHAARGGWGNVLHTACSVSDFSAFMSLYGFVADPVSVADHVSYLAGMLPLTGLDLIREQLQALAHQNTSSCWPHSPGHRSFTGSVRAGRKPNGAG